MDKEKLKEAASTASDNAVFDSDHWNNYNEGFIKGADWLMAQSLADRLTDEEKEKIRAEYRQGFYPQRNLLIELFGKDLFNDNPEMLK